MGMPVSVEIVDREASSKLINNVYDYFQKVDERYSTYKKNSEISKINRGLASSDWSKEMHQIMLLCEQTKHQTGGYFDIKRNGVLDPSGLIKGWAISNAAKLLKNKGARNFYIDAGGDIQTSGVNEDGLPWSVGIRNPFDRNQIVKILHIKDMAVATSGTAIRGNHIYNPFETDMPKGVVSLTVVGSDIYDADRFATAAFAMGEKGISFIESLPGFEGYMITSDETAILSTGFERYVLVNA